MSCGALAISSTLLEVSHHSPVLSPVLVHLPKENNNDETARLVSWLVPNGESVDRDQAIAEFETSKTTFEMNAPAAGIVQYRLEADTEVPVGSLVFMISPDGKALFPDAVPSTTSTLPAPTSAANHHHGKQGLPEVQLSEKARQLIAQHGLDPSVFVRPGLVRAQDVLDYLQTRKEAAAPAPSEAGVAPEPALTLKPAAGVPYRREELARNKRLEVAFLRAALSHTLTSSVTVAVPTLGLRQAAESAQVNLSAILVREVAQLLKQYPAFNAFCAGQQAHYYEQVNVGVALDAGQGLKVAILREADRKSLAELDQELRDRMAQYLNDELPVESLAGGTFTITDLSHEGATFFSPIIGEGQSAILAIGADLLNPRGDSGFYHLTLAFDHQLSNGREACRFLKELAARLTDYEKAWTRRLREEPYCHTCERTLSALRDIGGFLVQEAEHEGRKSLVCNLCLRGL